MLLNFASKTKAQTCQSISKIGGRARWGRGQAGGKDQSGGGRLGGRRLKRKTHGLTTLASPFTLCSFPFSLRHNKLQPMITLSSCADEALDFGFSRDHTEMRIPNAISIRCCNLETHIRTLIESEAWSKRQPYSKSQKTTLRLDKLGYGCLLA